MIFKMKTLFRHIFIFLCISKYSLSQTYTLDQSLLSLKQYADLELERIHDFARRIQRNDLQLVGPEYRFSLRLLRHEHDFLNDFILDIDTLGGHDLEQTFKSHRHTSEFRRITRLITDGLNATHMHINSLPTKDMTINTTMLESYLFRVKKIGSVLLEKC